MSALDSMTDQTKTRDAALNKLNALLDEMHTQDQRMKDPTVPEMEVMMILDRRNRIAEQIGWNMLVLLELGYSITLDK